MTQTFLIPFVGGALLLALLAALVLTGVAALVKGRTAWRWFAFAFATAFFVFLTHHPFPAPGSLQCPVPYMEPQLRPFNFIGLLSNPGFFAGIQPAAIAMNLAVCALIGALLARRTRSLAAAVALGIALPLLIETSQLTGIFGLYPCSYRQFDIDDLILNFTGIVGGFLLARRLRRA